MKSHDTREELTEELRRLRSLLREIGEQFILRREGEIESVISALAELPANCLRSESADWPSRIRQLRVKPAKGRLKDLKRIDDLIDKMTVDILNAQEGLKNSVVKKKE